jgi:hypothetical protein
MSDDVERVLQRVTPQSAGAELREQVLAAVARELAERSGHRWERRVGLAVAASILFAVALNVWTVTASNSRRAALLGPAPLPMQVVEICHAVEAVTDAETGRLIQQQLAAAWRSRPVRPPRSVGSFSGITINWRMIGKDYCDEEVPANPEVDRDRGGGPRRDTSDGRRGMVLEVFCTA